MNKFSKALCCIAVLALTAGSGCGIYYGIKYDKLLNQQQLDNSGTIKVIENLNLQLKDLNKQIIEIKTDNENNLKQISILEGEKTTLQSLLDEKINDCNAKAEEIVRLQERISLKDNEILELKNRHKTDSEKILELTNEVKRLSGLIEQYENIKNGTRQVVFYNGKEVCSVKVVGIGKTINETVTAERPGHTFLGWSLDGKTIIDDLSSYVVNEDTVFYGVFEMTAGLYNDEENIFYSFEELINQGMLATDYETLSAGINCQMLKGTLILPENSSLFSQLGNFNDCIYLKNIVISNSVRNISGHFKNCTNLETVYIFSTVENITDCLFDENSNVVVYCEPGERPQGWLDMTDVGNDYKWSGNATVNWGVTYEEYKSEVRTI